MQNLLTGRGLKRKITQKRIKIMTKKQTEQKLLQVEYLKQNLKQAAGPSTPITRRSMELPRNKVKNVEFVVEDTDSTTKAEKKRRSMRVVGFSDVLSEDINLEEPPILSGNQLVSEPPRSRNAQVQFKTDHA